MGLVLPALLIKGLVQLLAHGKHVTNEAVIVACCLQSLMVKLLNFFFFFYGLCLAQEQVLSECLLNNGIFNKCGWLLSL